MTKSVLDIKQDFSQIKILIFSLWGVFIPGNRESRAGS